MVNTQWHSKSKATLMYEWLWISRITGGPIYRGETLAATSCVSFETAHATPTVPSQWDYTTGKTGGIVSAMCYIFTDINNWIGVGSQSYAYITFNHILIQNLASNWHQGVVEDERVGDAVVLLDLHGDDGQTNQVTQQGSDLEMAVASPRGAGDIQRHLEAWVLCVQVIEALRLCRNRAASVSSRNMQTSQGFRTG